MNGGRMDGGAQSGFGAVSSRQVTLTVNGRRLSAMVPVNWTLQEMLKHEFALTGTKRACGRGECGSCTVILDGRPVNSCLTLAVECDGSEVRTIEGEALENGRLSELQQAFVDHGAVQCGFCTPGMIMSARALLERCPSPSRELIEEAISGNLCRCTGYEAIVDAIEAAAAGGAGEGSLEGAGTASGIRGRDEGSQCRSCGAGTVHRKHDDGDGCSCRGKGEA